MIEFRTQHLISLSRNLFLICLVLISPTQICQAATNCDAEYISKIAKNLHPKLMKNANTRIDKSLSACKVMPDDSNKNIVILAFPSANYPPAEDMTNYDIDVLIVDAVSSNVLSHWWQETALPSDAMEIQQTTIDTARYILAAGTRAFGLRVRYSNHSRVFQSSDETLTLFITDGKLLRPVLDGLYVYRQSGENSAGNDCSDETSIIKRTISINNNSNQKYRDLLIHEMVDTAKTKPPKCNTVHMKQVVREYKIQYKNNKYTVPKSLM